MDIMAIKQKNNISIKEVQNSIETELKTFQELGSVDFSVLFWQVGNPTKNGQYLCEVIPADINEHIPFKVLSDWKSSYGWDSHCYNCKVIKFALIEEKYIQ